MPFPTVQGTQAAIGAMMDAEHAAGLSPELLTYKNSGYSLRPPWRHHRAADPVGDRSLRSGPSWRKVVQDTLLAAEARRVAGRTRPDVVIAHHVEAAAAALAARLPNVTFFAHTALGAELPTYLPRGAFGSAPLARATGRAGEALDVMLCRRAARVFAVSPRLASGLERASGRPVRYVPVPWNVPAPIEPEERLRSRAALRLAPSVPVLLYAGNLDAYQGLEVLVAAFARVLRRDSSARLLVATGSPPDDLMRELRRSGCGRQTVFLPNATEPDRRAAHAAADVVWVPRGAPGGLPIKLLDALARGAPTVVTRRACAGLDLGDAAIAVADDDPDALAAAALLCVEGRAAAQKIGGRGRSYVEQHHSPQRYLQAVST